MCKIRVVQILPFSVPKSNLIIKTQFLLDCLICLFFPSTLYVMPAMQRSGKVNPPPLYITGVHLTIYDTCDYHNSFRYHSDITNASNINLGGDSYSKD